MYQKAHQAGIFNTEIAPYEVKGKKGMEHVTADEHPRHNATLADMIKLKPVFKVSVNSRLIFVSIECYNSVYDACRSTAL